MAETKVILTKSVANLGHPGDVVTVKAGYARNYLLPQGLGFAWTKGAAAQIEAMKRARLAKAVATREEAVAAKELIEGTNPKNITVEPIKTTGDFPATVALHPEITASFFVKVVAE